MSKSPARPRNLSLPLPDKHFPHDPHEFPPEKARSFAAGRAFSAAERVSRGEGKGVSLRSISKGSDRVPGRALDSGSGNLSNSIAKKAVCGSNSIQFSGVEKGIVQSYAHVGERFNLWELKCEMREKKLAIEGLRLKKMTSSKK
ncbi:hypothetical protein Acr_07g0012510 [Actinidia rufa]|uniref:Uncharacterized protein n=1 Tax=Actinidia rufa TaxID=165716 RepID=A0A7J0EX62_9ERIC|nr:hypothetical protein Acr_07g0012480 [Actinidia rufa]GFY91055.1 hypothetical protein Acr_07g0012510 [Actinidia rufa]